MTEGGRTTGGGGLMREQNEQDGGGDLKEKWCSDFEVVCDLFTLEIQYTLVFSHFSIFYITVKRIARHYGKSMTYWVYSICGSTCV